MGFIDTVYTRSLLLAHFVAYFESAEALRPALSALLSALQCRCLSVAECKGTALHFRERKGGKAKGDATSREWNEKSRHGGSGDVEEGAWRCRGDELRWRAMEMNLSMRVNGSVARDCRCDGDATVCVSVSYLIIYKYIIIDPCTV